MALVDLDYLLRLDFLEYQYHLLVLEHLERQSDQLLLFPQLIHYHHDPLVTLYFLEGLVDQVNHAVLCNLLVLCHQEFRSPPLHLGYLVGLWILFHLVGQVDLVDLGFLRVQQVLEDLELLLVQVDQSLPSDLN